MDAELRRHASEAIDRLQQVLDRGPDVQHAEVRAAALSVIAFRDRVVETHRDGAAPEAWLDRSNALVSLAYGAEFPLSGLHFNRIRQTRDGLRTLLSDGA